jgi:hypothetical protein
MMDASVPDGGATLESLTSPDLQISKGGSRTLEVTGHYSDGSSMVLDAGPTFLSLAEATATVSAAGVVTGVAPGTATVRVSMSGVHVDVDVTVLDAFAILRDVSDFWQVPGGSFDVASSDGSVTTMDASDPVYEGATSVAATFTGSQAWGGFFLSFDSEAPFDLSAFEGGSLVLRIAEDEGLGNLNVKIEWASGSHEISLSPAYTPTEDGSGFLTYVIPLADFTGIDLSQVTIPLGIWNPMAPAVVVPDAGPMAPEPYAGTLYIDDVYYVAPAP